MKFSKPICPTCGEAAKGVLQTVQGIALLDFYGDNGKADYAGETKIWWDEQRTVKDKDGLVTLVCDQGHDWQSKKED